MKTFFAWRIIQMLICFNAVFVFPFLLNAQNEPPQQARITGQVLEKESGEPLEAVALIINELDQFSITDKDGRFIFETIPPGKITINAQCLGMVEVFEEIQIDEYKEYEVVIEMERSSLSLEEVQVIAKSSRSGLSSSSDISKAAIEHLQASSLGDILQLIPGQLADNPDLSQANQISLRQVGEDKLNALGTSIIVDGSPLSNNANLQASNPAFGGTSGYAGTVSGGGIDLRQISTENIESITVIRGIPSVEHGDLTSGALLVETRAGRTPYQARVRVNPRINQINLGKGFDFGDNAGSLNIDVDYLESVNDQRMEYMG
ncbi:MAG: carboxypeptidase-like regulatory domain-containing protein, partial [Bacteroidales bacterium]